MSCVYPANAAVPCNAFWFCVTPWCAAAVRCNCACVSLRLCVCVCVCVFVCLSASVSMAIALCLSPSLVVVVNVCMCISVPCVRVGVCGAVCFCTRVQNSVRLSTIFRSFATRRILQTISPGLQRCLQKSIFSEANSQASPLDSHSCNPNHAERTSLRSYTNAISNRTQKARPARSHAAHGNPEYDALASTLC